MSREDDAKIAEWRGMEVTHYKGSGEVRSTVPNYTTSDAAAITLLPVLVERGYTYNLCDLTPEWVEFLIYRDVATHSVAAGLQPTIAAAVSSAVLELIGRYGK